MASSAARAHHHVSTLAQADLPLRELGAELSAALSELIPHEGFSLIGFDPVSGLRTFATELNMLKGDIEARLVHNETVEHDLHRFTDLAGRHNPVGTLGGGTPGEERSPRLHELLAEQGFGRELRLALRGRGTLWGALVLLRERGRPPFTDQDAISATAIAPPLTRAVRHVSVRPRGQPPPPLSPGVVLVRPDDTAEAISPEAAAWLSDFYTVGHPLPYVVFQAVAAARNKHGARAGQLARIRTRSGRWLCLTTCLLGGGRVAVVLQPATTDQLLPAIAAWHEFTPRQLDVLHLLRKLIPSSRLRGACNCPLIPSRITSRPSTARPEPTVSKNSLPHFGKQVECQRPCVHGHDGRLAAPAPHATSVQPRAA